jgi:hypothetical protein
MVADLLVQACRTRNHADAQDGDFRLVADFVGLRGDQVFESVEIMVVAERFAGYVGDLRAQGHFAGPGETEQLHMHAVILDALAQVVPVLRIAAFDRFSKG